MERYLELAKVGLFDGRSEGETEKRVSDFVGKEALCRD
jgi:hypothetical protein